MKLPGAVRTGVRGLAMMPSIAAYESQKAQSFSQIGQAIGGTVDKIEQQNIKTKEDKARDFAIEQNNQFSQDFAMMDRQLRQDSKTGDEYEKGMTTFMESARTYADEIAGDEYQTEAAQSLFSDLKAKNYSYITRTAQDLNKAYSAGLVNDLINTEVSNVYNNPDLSEQSLKLSIAAIDSSQLTEIEKQEKKRMVRNDIGYIKITSIADADPDKALKMLQEPSYIKNMPPQKLLQLTQYASRKASEQDSAYIAQQRKFDKLADEREKFIEESTAKDLFDKQAANELTLDDVQGNRDNLSQTDYKYFLGEASGTKSGKATTNINEYVRLYSLAEQYPILARDFAKDVLLKGDLTLQDFNKIVNYADAQEKGEIPTPYKQATNYLSRVSRSNELNPPIGAGERYANASNDFNQWFAENQNADPVETINKVEEIWSQYQITESPIVVSGKLPFGIKKARNKLEMSDIIEAKTSLQKEYESGKISEEQYQKSKQNIITWKKYLESKQ